MLLCSTCHANYYFSSLFKPFSLSPCYSHLHLILGFSSSQALLSHPPTLKKLRLSIFKRKYWFSLSPPPLPPFSLPFLVLALCCRSCPLRYHSSVTTPMRLKGCYFSPGGRREGKPTARHSPPSPLALAFLMSCRSPFNPPSHPILLFSFSGSPFIPPTFSLPLPFPTCSPL